MLAKTINIIDRWIVLVLAAAAVAAGVIILMVAADWRSPADIAPSGWFRDQLTTIDNLTGRDRNLAITGTLIGGGVALLLLLMQFVPLLSRGKKPATQDAQGNRVKVDRRSLEKLVNQAAADTPNVYKAHSRIKETDRGVLVKTRAEVDPSSNISQVSSELSDNIRHALQSRGGVTVAGVDLKLELGKSREEREHSRWHLPFQTNRH